MNEHDRSNQLIWAIAVVGLVFFLSVGLVLSTGGPLPSKAKEVPTKKRGLQLEARMKVPPTFDTSQLEAQLKGLESQLAAVQTQLGAFRVSDFDALKTKIDRAGKANSESVKTRIDALQTDVGNLHTRFDQLSQQAAPVTAPDPKQSSQKSQHSK